MCNKRKVNLFAEVGPPLGKESVVRFDWQCKTLAVWCGTTESIIRGTLVGFISGEINQLHAKLMRISAARFGENNHPYLYDYQMNEILYPVLVHAVDVVAKLNPPMDCLRSIQDGDSLCLNIRQAFKEMVKSLPSRLESLLDCFAFETAFEKLRMELELVVEQSNEPQPLQ